MVFGVGCVVCAMRFAGCDIVRGCSGSNSALERRGILR
jgi:hypothetical protein